MNCQVFRNTTKAIRDTVFRKRGEADFKLDFYEVEAFAYLAIAMGGAAGGEDAGAGSASAFAIAALLINNTVGAGLLALPYVFLRSSLVPGAAAMALTGSLNFLMAVLIAHCCELCGGARSYSELATRALGARAAALVSALMAVYTLGSCASYAVLLGDALPELADSGALPAAVAAGPLGSRAVLLPAAAALVLLPLSAQRTLRSLRFTAGASFLAILYIAALVVSRAARAPPAASVVDVGPGAGLFVGIPITMVSFTCHYNVPRMYFELERRSLARMAAAAAACFSFAMLVYQGTAFAGYSLFGAATKNDILANFADDDAAALAARVALVLVMCFSFPIVFNNFRATVCGMLPRALQDRIDLAGTCRSGDGAGGEGNAVREGGAALSAGPLARCGAAFAATVRDWPFIAFTAVLVAFCVLVAVVVPDLGLILGYKGALGASLILYVLPGVFFFVLTRRRGAAAAGRAEALLLRGGGGGGGGGSDDGVEGEDGMPLLKTPDTPRRVPASRFLSFVAAPSARSTASSSFWFGRPAAAGAGGGGGGGDGSEDEARATHTPLLWTAAASTPASALASPAPDSVSVASPGGAGAGIDADTDVGAFDAAGFALELVSTRHGAACIALVVWGFSVMILGTLTTAGLLK